MSQGVTAGGPEAAKAAWGLRACACCFLIGPFAAFGAFCGVYWGLMSEAMDANELAEAGGYNGDINWYDTCGTGNLQNAFLDEADQVELNTKWSIALKFNAYLYLILLILLFLMLIGTFLAPLVCCGCLAVSCGGCAHTAAIIFTGVMRLRTEGDECA